MLMCPQHLQQQDLYYDANLGARIQALNEYNWGVVSMTIDQGELSSGTFKISQFSGVLSGGLPLDFALGDVGIPASRPVDTHFTGTTAMLEVYLGVKIGREGIANYQDTLDESASARFRISNRPVPDLTVAKSEQIISFGRPNAVILFGNESREDFETIKIAEVLRDATGHYRQSTNYIAPSVRVSASQVLNGYLQDLLSTMLAKQRALAETRRQIDAAAVEFTSQDITRFLLLNALSTNIPVIRHIVDTKTDSPLAAYITLIQLAGSLTTFSGDIDPSTFPLYQHNDLRSTFEPLVALLNKMLGATVKERCITVPLEPRQDGMWIGQLKDERLPRCTSFVLAVDAQSPQQDTANRLPKLSKIASWKQIGQIVRAATPGVPLTVTHRPPPEIPVRPKQVYFLLNIDDPYWRAISTEKTVAIYLPPPFDPSKAQIVLMGIPERAGA